MIKILAIGNSFSHDALYYLHDIAKAGGIETRVVNLYIPGCSLQTHWDNAENDRIAYLYELNGRSTNDHVSIKGALEEEEWDYISLQQASHDSGIEETYYPYIINLRDYVKKYRPKAEILLHQTWAYEIDSDHKAFERYNHSQKEMYERLCRAYRRAADELGVRMIPCGDVVQKVRSREPFIYEKGGMSLCSDGYHMQIPYGRYLLAATWYEFLFDRCILENPYVPDTGHEVEKNIDPGAMRVLKECVHEVVGGRSETGRK